MLTMPKLIAAILIAFAAWIVSGLVKVEVREVYGTYNFGWFVPLSVVMGFLCGWLILGKRGDGTLGFGTAPAIGLTAMLAGVAWVLFLVSANEVLRLAIARRYDGPVETVLALVPVGKDYAQYLIRQNIGLTILIMGMVAGWFTDWAARRWR